MKWFMIAYVVVVLASGVVSGWALHRFWSWPLLGATPAGVVVSGVVAVGIFCWVMSHTRLTG